jgi:zinc/manganese transport system ATP-binding protein
MPSLCSLVNLTVSYHRHPIIHHVNCELKHHTTTAIIGANGAGKSTLLKTIIGEVQAESGEVILTGIRQQDIAYLPQIISIDTAIPLCVSDVVLLGSYQQIGMSRRINKNHLNMVEQCLQQVQLSGLANKSIHELSRGQMQRVMMARIIMQQSDFILLDEPLNALDKTSVDIILSLIGLWQQQQKTVIAVIHDLNYAIHAFEYTMLLTKGEIFYDKTNNILADSQRLQQAYNISSLPPIDTIGELCQQ